MGKLRRITNITVFILFISSQLGAADWQGMANRARVGDFPAGGYYAASSAFSKNSLVDVTNPTSGKTIRVIIIKESSDPNVFLSLSPEASDALGILPDQVISLKAAIVPLPSGFGARSENDTKSLDPDYFPTPSTTNGQVATTNAGNNKPDQTAEPSKKPTPSPLPSATHLKTPEPTPEPTPDPTPEPTATPLKSTEPSPTPAPTPSPTPVATPEPSVSPSPTPESSKTPTPTPEPSNAQLVDASVGNIKPKDDLSKNSSLPTPSPKIVERSPEPTDKPRAWVGIKNGFSILEGSDLDAGFLGSEAKRSTPTPTPSPTPKIAVNTATPAPSATPTPAPGGLAQGLGNYNGRNLLNNGDVARPDQSIWLKAAVKPSSTPGLNSPKLSKDLDLKGPDSSLAKISPKPNTNVGKVDLVGPKITPKPTGESIATKTPSPSKDPASDLQEGFFSGNGILAKQIGDAQNRGKVRTFSVDQPTDDGADPGTVGVNAPGENKVSADLPSAKLAKQELADSFNSKSGDARQSRASDILANPKLSAEEKTTAIAQLYAPKEKVDDILANPKLTKEEKTAALAQLYAPKASVDAILADPKLTSEEKTSALAHLVPPKDAVPEFLAEARLGEDERTEVLKNLTAPADKIPDSLAIAKLASDEKPDGASSAKAPELSYIPGDLPESLVLSEARPEASIANGAVSKTNIEHDLPVVVAPNSEAPESNTFVKAATPIIETDLAEARVTGNERPELPVPLASADKIVVSFEAADYRPPSPSVLDNKVDAALNANPEKANTEIADLSAPRSPDTVSIDSGLPGLTYVPKGFDYALYEPSKSAQTSDYISKRNAGTDAALSDPKVKQAENADPSLAGNTKTTNTLVADLKDPNAKNNFADGSVYIYGPNGERTLLTDLINPKVNEAGKVEADLNGPKKTADSVTNPLVDPKNIAQADVNGKKAPGDNSVAVDLKNPKDPAKTTTDGGIKIIDPKSNGTDVSLQDPKDTKVDPGKNINAPDNSKVTDPKLADVKDPKTNTVVVDNTKTNTATDNRLQTILSYLEPAGSRPPSTKETTKVDLVPDTSSKVIAGEYADKDWAVKNLPIVYKLEKKLWYVQVGSFDSPKTAQDNIKKIAPGYPIVVLPEVSGKKGVYKVFVGPLKIDEKGLILTWFRAHGFRDAYAREGAID